MKNRKLALTLVMLLLGYGLTYAQQLNNAQFSMEIKKLSWLKWQFEEFTAKKRWVNADSVLILYKEQISKLKENQKEYLKYMRIAIRYSKDTLKTKSIPYKYSSFSGIYDPKFHLIKDIDLYRVVRYSLFKRNDDMLPTDFRGLPIVDENNYKPKYAPKPAGYKLALRFLLDSAGFNSNEKKMLRKVENPDVVMQIKEYLDEKGLTIENIEFVKWALEQLVSPNNNINIVVLEALYEPNRNENYVPRDREPTNQP